jgi:hypothetical protein
MRSLRSKFSNKIFFVILSGFLLLLPGITLAQDTPCEGDDPFSSTPCPLDTWVWVLVIISAILGAVYLYRQQKTQKHV